MQSQQSVDVAKMEQDIKDAHEVYNSSLEEFTDKEHSLRELECSSFSLLQNLYKQFKHTDPSAHHSLKNLENDYHNSLSDIEEKRKECYEKQSICLRNIQKLRTLQNNYLVGLINGLQSQLAELRGSNTEHVQEQRANNLV